MRLTFKLIITLFMAITLKTSDAQKVEKTKKITIKTSAQCEMCKERLEKAMAYEKGVVSSSLDLKTANLEVIYKFAKTNPVKIREAISEIGYDADDIKASDRSYKKLPLCCQKNGMEH